MKKYTLFLIGGLLIGSLITIGFSVQSQGFNLWNLYNNYVKPINPNWSIGSTTNRIISVNATTGDFITLNVGNWKIATSVVVCMAPATCQFQADGTADDVQIQAAIDYASSTGGGIVFIKAGTYQISNNNAIPAYVSTRANYCGLIIKDKVKIIGEGIGKTILNTATFNATTSGSKFVTISSSAAGIGDLEISNMTIQVPAYLPGAGGYWGTGILLEGTDNSILRDLYLINGSWALIGYTSSFSTSTKILTTDSYNHLVDNVTIDSYLGSASMAKIKNVVIKDCKFLEAHDDSLIIFVAAQNIDITNNLFDGESATGGAATAHIYLLNDSSLTSDVNAVSNIKIDNNTVINSTMASGIVFLVTKDIFITNNYIKNCQNGIYNVSGGSFNENIHIEGNNISHCSDHGIEIGSGAVGSYNKNIHIVNNKIYNNTTTGIYITTTITDALNNFIITGNDIYDDQDTPTQTYGIYLWNNAADTSICNGFIIANNNIHDTTTPFSTTLGTDDQFLGNIILQPGGGNVGIGTTTPATLFTVATTSNIFNVLSNLTVGVSSSSPAYTFGVQGTIGTTGAITGSNISVASTTIWDNAVYLNSASSTLWSNKYSTSSDLFVYNTGDAITGAITMTADNTDNYIPLTITQNDTTNNPDGLSIVNAAASNALSIDQNGNIAGAVVIENTGNNNYGLYVYSNMNVNAAASLVTFQADNVAFDNAVLGIIQDGTGIGITLQNNGTGNGIYIDQNGNGQSLYINTSSTEEALWIYSDVGASVIDPLVFFEADNTGFDTTVLQIQNDGTGNGIFLDQNGLGIALNIDSEATSTNLIQADSQNTSANLLQLSVNSANKFVIDYAGTTTIAGNLAVTGSVVGSNITVASTTIWDNAIYLTPASSTAWSNKQAGDADLTAIAALATTSGNLIVASTTGGWNTLAVGTDGLCLQASSSQSLGVVWASCATGAVAGVSSLNTLDGALTLWGTNGVITVTPSSTVGLVFDVPNNATTGVATLSSLTSIGSTLTGVLKATAGSLATSTTLTQGSYSISIAGATTTINNACVKKTFQYVITRVSGNSDVGTTTQNLEIRTEATPNSGGSLVLSSSLVIGVAGTASSTAFTSSTVPALSPVCASTTAVVGTSVNTVMYVEYTITP